MTLTATPESASAGTIAEELALQDVPAATVAASSGADVADPSVSAAEAGGVSREVAKHLATGTSALGTGVLVERGLGFAANILAARLGGAATFGAYSLAITTAASISTYAAGGIGATAARFSGKYPHGTAGYSTLARALAIVSLASAALAAVVLWIGAEPLAHLLGRQSLAPLLRWAAFSAAGILLLECARGFFVGQRRLRALLLLSVIVGLGMLALVPLAAAHHSPSRMALSQAAVTGTAVMVCLLLARPLGLLPSVRSATPPPLAPVLGEVWTFGMVQLAGMVGINLAGWWLTTLVARADTSLVQMGFFAIANQLRNIVGLAPSLLTESSYAIMARTAGSTAEKTPDRTPDQVMALCTWLSTASALALSAAGIVVVPWALKLLYGRAYGAASVTAALGLALAVVHMGNSPAAARLTILSIRTTGVINTVWALFVAAAGTLLLVRAGSAASAMAVFLAGHLLSAALVLIALRRHSAVPAGMVRVFALGAGTAIALAAMAWLRALLPALAVPLTLGMLALLALALTALAVLGRRYHWLPGAAVLRELLGSLRRRLLAARDSQVQP